MSRLCLKIVCLSFLAGAPAAFAAELPAYDMDAYCVELAQHGGGAEELIADCMRLEQTARTGLSVQWAALSEQTQDSCIQIGLLGGESYDLLKACVEELAR